MTMPTYDLFISHSTRRHTRWYEMVERLAAALERRDVRVFWDGIMPHGVPLLPALQDAIDRARAGLVVHTPGAISSSWVELEIAMIRRRHATSRMQLIAIRLDATCEWLPGVPWDEAIEAGPVPIDISRVANAVVLALRR